MKPKIILVVAAASGNRVIGNSDNQIPWPRFKSDMEHFRKITLGNPVIMGRVTFETFPRINGFPKPLHNRQNIVVTRNENYIVPENVWIASSTEDAIQKAYILKPEYVCIIGGQQIYEQTVGMADEIFYTEIKIDAKGSTFFPEIPHSFRLKNLSTLSEEVVFPDSSTQIIELEFHHWVQK